RTPADSKLGGDHCRGSTSLELYRGSLLQLAAQRLQKILKWRIIRLFIDLLTLIPKRTPTSRLLPLSNS
ncbi:hypothetical protein B296_00021874, partial [Ensete ventricosum]